MALLEVKGLTTRFNTEEGEVFPTRDVSFSVEPGEVVGLVGESGSGKSVTSRAILQLVEPASAVRGGEILFKNRNLRNLSTAALRQMRATEIAMIFQDPMTSLNPVLTVGEQLTRVFATHHQAGGTRRAIAAKAREQAVELLTRVGIPDPAYRLDQYPHEFSGGMRQRVLIAMALMCNPQLLIADEPTTALDVTVERQVLQLIRSLQREFGMSVIFITHNLGVVAQLCDRVMVMYAGRIVEKAPTRDLFRSPQHPYTQALLRSHPYGRKNVNQLEPIRGEPPNLAKLPAGCPFQERCPLAVETCRTEQALRPIAKDRFVACHKAPFDATRPHHQAFEEA